MRSSAVAGLIFANVNDDLLKGLTAERSMASVPFGARYRLIDFSLSNLVNAGITRVGIITKENYRSLMDHVGSGIYWDLDRKDGGLYFLPPYSSEGIKRYTGSVNALVAARDYIKHCKSDYIVLCDADVLANVDVSAAIDSHIKSNADITVVYHNGEVPENTGDTMLLDVAENGRIEKIGFEVKHEQVADFSIGITIIGKELLLELAAPASTEELTSFNRDVIAKKLKQLKICGFKHSDYVIFMNSTDSYYRASMDLLNADIRRQLFNKERPVYTKTRDDMPTRYGINSKVNNCVIADGCVINGTVKNSILFRGVKVEKGAVVENCIIMQETTIGSNANLYNVVTDKNAVIGDDMVLKGTKEKCFFVKKNQII